MTEKKSLTKDEIVHLLRTDVADPKESKGADFNVWKSVQHGYFDNFSELWEEIKTQFSVGYDCGTFIDSINQSVATKAFETRLTLVHSRDIGVTKPIPIWDFYTLAKKKGLGLCTPEQALLARLAYSGSEQIKTESDLWWIDFAMESVSIGGIPHNLQIGAGTRGPRLDAVRTPLMVDPTARKDNWIFVIQE